MLAIDPGSNTLGWALFDKGHFVRSGKISARGKDLAHTRLLHIIDELVDIAGVMHDVVCVEKLFRYNASLVWSVGAVIAATRPEVLIEVPIRLWQARLDENYVKSDERDAIEIGKTLIEYAV